MFRSVCLLVTTMSCASMAQAIEMPFGLWTQLGPRHQLGLGSFRGRGNFGGRPVWCSTHTRLMALFPGLPGWAGTRKVKPIWSLLKQETVSISGISWAVCKSASRSRQITTPIPHHSVFYRPVALAADQPTASKHWRLPVWCSLLSKLSDHLLFCAVFCWWHLQ